MKVLTLFISVALTTRAIWTWRIFGLELDLTSQIYKPVAMRKPTEYLIVDFMTLRLNRSKNKIINFIDLCLCARLMTQSREPNKVVPAIISEGNLNYATRKVGNDNFVTPQIGIIEIV